MVLAVDSVHAFVSQRNIDGAQRASARHELIAVKAEDKRLLAVDTMDRD
jgi:hypothetical protein